ncbi:hypothetical protein [Methanococcus maripaludis]|uniref:Chromosome segregation ATPase n=1 Tax=Methanococcus maripaludis TaxID=39152 RepID=A0A8T4H3Q6_METMI|nr:hypothetical protein [Methanococcus maripaludis]MBM7408758.1 chromosome segregation ATPase [Methanococcus maripaludis]MBP2219073.1 chromosome segregation ATPase [Methanococcus maripaludis]
MDPKEKYNALREELDDIEKTIAGSDSELIDLQAQLEAIMEEAAPIESEIEDIQDEIEDCYNSKNKIKKEMADILLQNPGIMDNDKEYCERRRKETLSENNLKLDDLLVKS